MNDAHLHLIVNHFPIIGTIFGTGIIIAGIFYKSDVIKNVAYVLFVVAAIFGAISMNTGEGAEEIVEQIPEIGHKIIHDHEEMAEKLILVLYALGIISLLGMYMNIKKHAKAKLVSYIAVLVSIVGIFFAQKTGTTGGAIRHTEIREHVSNKSIESSKHENEHDASNEKE